jgi:inhibitor of cysteine peptidase
MTPRRLAVVTLCLAALALLFGAACSASAARSARTVNVGKARDGKTVTLHRGDKLVVSLAGNPTTGYNWKLKSVDRSVLRPLGMKYIPDQHAPNVVGSGGVYKLSFKALARGETELRLSYLRSFEPNKPADSFRLHVVVK